MKTYHLSVSDLALACQNARAESVKSLVIQYNGVNLPVVNAAVVPNRLSSDLALFVGGTRHNQARQMTLKRHF